MLTPEQRKLVASSDSTIRWAVHRLIKRMPSRAEMSEDLVQQGYVIACEAITKFDPSKGSTWLSFLKLHLQNLAEQHRVWSNPAKADKGFVARGSGSTATEEIYDPRPDIRLDEARISKAVRTHIHRAARYPRHATMALSRLEGQAFDDIGVKWGVSKQYVEQVYQEIVGPFCRAKAKAAA